MSEFKAKKIKKETKEKKVSPLMKIKYSISEELFNVIGVEEAPRPTIVKLIWKYIKEKKLQGHKGDKRMIVPDKTMAKIWGKEPFNMFKIVGKLSQHIKRIR